MPEQMKQNTQVPGSVYTITEQDAQASPSIITCILSLIGHDARILIDPRSTYSFIACHYMKHVDSLPELLNFVLTISTPLENTMLVELVYRSCVFRIDDRELLVDLIILDMEDFDVIMGMTWLATHHATIYCYSKEVVFHIPGHPKLSF